MSDQEQAFRVKLALHLLPLSICLRGVYFIAAYQILMMAAYPSTLRWFPFLALLTGILIEWQAINLLRRYNVVPARGEDDDDE